MNKTTKGRTSLKRTKKAPRTETTYEAFRTFVGKKGSDIVLKHSGRLLSNFPRRKRNRTFESFFSTAAEKIDKGADAQEKFLMRMFVLFGEIDSSIENLKAVPVFLEAEPSTKRYKKAGITGRRHLTYHLGNYLQEIYILRCRIKTFLDFLKKQLRKKGKLEASREFDQCLELLKNKLEPIVTIRGAHVHVRADTDKDLFTLELLDLVGEHHQTLQLGYKLLLVAERLKWLNWIRKTNGSVMSMVNGVFDIVNKHVIEQ